MTTRNFRVKNGIEVGDITISASAGTITGMATAAPSADGDVANKKYVDDQLSAKTALTVGNDNITVADGSVTTTVNGNTEMTVTDDGVRVHGNLTVDGSTVTINTTTLSVEDNMIEVNRNVSAASGMPNYSGLKANRGETATATDEDLFWVWDETFSDDGTSTYGNAGGAWTAYRSDDDLSNKDLVDIRANEVHATSTSAQYADLAEKYTTDAEYEPGTVMMFSGDPEVTMCDQDMCTKVAGVISENPAYLMNASLTNSAAVVALMGRVKVKVKGTVEPGDMLVSAGDGFARAESNPALGSVIGKALSSHSESEGTIEMVVGRC